MDGILQSAQWLSLQCGYEAGPASDVSIVVAEWFPAPAAARNLSQMITITTNNVDERMNA